MLCRTEVLSAASTPSLGPYLVIRGPSSWALLAAVGVLGYRIGCAIPEFCWLQAAWPLAASCAERLPERYLRKASSEFLVHADSGASAP